MSQITLDKATPQDAAPFTVNLRNKETGELESHKYLVKRLDNSTIIKTQLLQAEFAHDKSREEIVGSTLVKEILANTVPDNPDTPELINLFGFLGDAELTKLLEALVTAAKSSSVDNVEQGVE